ncbi:TetR/AcrR family transcriptional regulator [Pseudomonas vancouverensis]|uniref:TetR/AcrR family transcriptional regulator n=1 Tax=Pseudomonas vancouverensis TaxID=95300 RepID=UPI003CFF06B7
MSDEQFKSGERGDAYQYDLEVIRRVEGVVPPKQARSSAVLQRILRAMDKLIYEKDFDSITIPEVAALAGCGMAAIYSRFKDKASILAALHESLRSNLLSVDEVFPPGDWQIHTVDENLRALVHRLVEYYSNNRGLLTATLMMKDLGCYERAAKNISHISKLLTEHLFEHVENGREVINPEAVDVGVRAVFATLQQRLIFFPVLVGSHAPQTDEELCDQLTRLLRSTIFFQ